MRGSRLGGMLCADEYGPAGGGVVGESGQVGFMCSSGERPLKSARKSDDWARR